MMEEDMAGSRPLSAQVKGVVKRAMRSVGANPASALEVAQLRLQVNDLSNELRTLASALDDHRQREGDLIESAELLRSEVARLAESVAGALHRIHLHEMQIAQLDKTVERLGGSIQDEVALDRRLARIEDRVSDPAEPVGET
jgi:chromosome segregation ATPase